LPLFPLLFIEFFYFKFYVKVLLLADCKAKLPVQFPQLYFNILQLFHCKAAKGMLLDLRMPVGKPSFLSLLTRSALLKPLKRPKYHQNDRQ
jgi:hypothetical protein